MSRYPDEEKIFQIPNKPNSQKFWTNLWDKNLEINKIPWTRTSGNFYKILVIRIKKIPKNTIPEKFLKNPRDKCFEIPKSRWCKFGEQTFWIPRIRRKYRKNPECHKTKEIQKNCHQSSGFRDIPKNRISIPGIWSSDFLNSGPVSGILRFSEFFEWTKAQKSLSRI